MEPLWRVPRPRVRLQRRRDSEHDVNRDGSTNTTDASQIKLRFGQDAATAGPEYDYNTSGTVNTTDFSQIKLSFGNTAGECP